MHAWSSVQCAMDYDFAKLFTLCRTCPEGFVLRSLEERHAEVVSAYWPYSNNVEAKQEFFKSLIKKFHSVGLFAQEDPNKPIAWSLQYPYGPPANLYVIEKYRRRGFASLLMEHMCKCIQTDGLVPWAGVEVSNDSGKELLRRMGFVELGKLRYLTTDM